MPIIVKAANDPIVAFISEHYGFWYPDAVGVNGVSQAANFQAFGVVTVNDKPAVLRLIDEANARGDRLATLTAQKVAQQLTTP